MSSWAYRCRPCEAGHADWFVSQIDAAQLGPDAQFVRVRVGGQWKCALLDRSETVVVEDQLLREVIASDERDCPECAELLRQRDASHLAETDRASSSVDASGNAGVFATGTERSAGGPKVQAAAISRQGIPFVVVAVSMTLLSSPGEATMAIEDLQPYFGGAPIVLMALKDDQSPLYYGDSTLVKLLEGIPIDKMPWQEYAIG
jgi:hypothetical protein